MANDDLSRWQGKVDGHIEITTERITTLFEKNDVTNEKIQLLDDELTKRLTELKETLTKDLTDLARDFTNLSSRLAVIAVIASFVGTVVTSLFVTAIIKIFLK